MPLAIDLFCGLGGWTEGFLIEGYDVIGFDIKRHDYGSGVYPSQIVLQDVTTLDGHQFRKAAVLIASPPCQAYSYRAMPWARGKEIPPPDNTLFEACFRIQREASEAAGRYVPLIVENVRGAEAWVGPARWHFGSYYLWGDVPALMPRDIKSERKVSGINLSKVGFNVAAAQRMRAAHNLNKQSRSRDATSQRVPRKERPDYPYSPGDSRLAASAEIAKIPLALAQHIARVFKD